jgi:hypothetical protein
MIQKNIPMADSSIYACGSERMIQDALDIALLHGLSEIDFYSDAFINTK